MNNCITSLPKLYSGKVRDLYNIDEKYMLMIASDRLSAFDVILNQEIPKKGVYLTQISLFWMNRLKHIIANHLSDKKLANYLNGNELTYANGRGVIVKKLKPVPIEVIVRGYLAGSGYKDYIATGKISGISIPPGLEKAEKLPAPIFTPSTKAAVGDHDENITLTQCYNLIGKELTLQIEKVALELYTSANEFANTHGIILADTKFEFGLDENGMLILMDEVLTPDSSRFWDANTFKIGVEPDSFDKQFVRNYLEKEINWNKIPPIPDLPSEVIAKTSDKYYEIIRRFNIST
ncbi:MAG: phosphoribosylaminoimidazole-succinocarboxamide synthase [Burkholderiales bacterium]|jgi:phosphoribosylaminoimidazole-succinocarboxamide synthase|nr:phosphoribosylaminoimidazole-succinocarboxamide synthase [Burkholderiales bacterium]